MSAKSSYRNNYLTILNVISCIAVVYLHANGCFWHYSTARYWATANIIENVCYFAVPVFFMCSGVTLIDYRKKYSTRIYWLSVKACGISEGFALVGSGSYPLASGRNTRHLDSHSPFVEPSLSGY